MDRIKLCLLPFFLVFFITGLPTQSYAESEEAEGDTEELGTIVVTASRYAEGIEEVPASVTVIDGEEIEARKAVALDETLGTAAGLGVFRQGSLGEESNIRLRGAEYNHVLVLIDGVKANSPLDGAFDFGDILAEQIDRVEVVRGCMSALYGSEAMGGVVNILSARGTGPTRYSLLLEGGSRGTFRASASVQGQTDRVRYSFGGSRTDENTHSERDTFSANAFNGHVEIDLGGSTMLQVTSRYLGSEKELGIFFYWPGDPADSDIPSQDGTITFTHDPNRDLERERLFSSIGLIHELYDWWTLEVKGGLVLDDLYENNEIDPDAEHVTMSGRLNMDARRLVATVQNRFWIGDLDTIVAGFEYTDERFMLNEYGTVNTAGYGQAPDFDQTPDFVNVDERRRNSAFFLQNNFHWDESLFVSAGVRVDYSDDYGTVVSPRGAVAYHFHRTDTRLRAGVGTGFRAPTFYELYYSPFGDPTLDPEEPPLDPEESISYEAGFDQGLLDRRVRIGATVFYIDYNELIRTNPDYVPGVPGLYWLINTGEAFSRGVEAEIRILPLEGLELGAAYTYLETEDLDTGEELPIRPRHQTHLSATYRRGPILARVDAHLVGSHFDDLPYIDIHGDLFTPGRRDGYSHLDLALSYTLEEPFRWIDELTPHIRLSNILDEDYEAVGGLPAPGFSTIVGLRASF